MCQHCRACLHLCVLSFGLAGLRCGPIQFRQPGESSVCRVNLEIPTVTVQCEDCSVDATVHIGSRALPSVWNSYRDKIEVCLTV